MSPTDSTPSVDALIAYAERDPARLHVPGHKGGPGADPAMLRLVGDAGVHDDIPALIHGVDIGEEPTPLRQARRLAAEAWGAERTWFLVNGASQGNQAACLALAHMGERVVVQRNVHSSVIDGMVLGGLSPSFVAAEIDPELGVAHCLTPESLAAALDRAPEAVAAMVVSPTYFGACADIAAMVEVAHSRDVPLIVDEAWGAHLRFHPDLPPDALSCGADLVLSSTHKILGSLTQSAMIHLGAESRLEEDVIDRCISLVETTSPSALLCGSLDAARRQAAVHGEELLGETIETLRRTRAAIREIPGLDVLDDAMVGRSGVAGWDPLRLSIDTRGTGASGYRLGEMTRAEEDINFELTSEHVVVCVFGMGAPAAPEAERLLRALQATVDRLDAEPPVKRPEFAPPPPWGEVALSPREAFLGPQDVVPFSEAAGRIAAESLAAYPPGIPNVLPGERLTKETLDYISESVTHGGFVRGATDRELRTLRVSREA